MTTRVKQGRLIFFGGVVLIFGWGRLQFLGKVIFSFWVNRLQFSAEVVFNFWIRSSFFFGAVVFIFGWGCLHFLGEFVFIFMWGRLQFLGEIFLIFWLRSSSFLGEVVFIFGLKSSLILCEVVIQWYKDTYTKWYTGTHIHNDTYWHYDDRGPPGSSHRKGKRCDFNPFIFSSFCQKLSLFNN